MKVLFSPLGNNDPVSPGNDKEGSLLQICRKYKPEKIYLYMSKEILEYHKKDNRYLMLLEELYKTLGLEFEYEIIERPELIDVHKYDYFYKDFKEVLNNIYSSNKKAEILINIASGTPAMKSALYVLTAISDFKISPVQVSTPVRSANYKVEDYLPELYIEVVQNTSANPEKYENRAFKAEMDNLNYELKKEIIKNHLKEYDYPAALTVAETIRNFLPNSSYNLIKAGVYRIDLNAEKRDEYIRKSRSNFYIYEGDYASAIEYILYLDIIRKRGLILEFIRGITPLVYELFLIILDKECNIKIEDYTNKSNDGIKWSEEKLRSEGKELLEILNAAYDNNFIIDSNVYGDHINKIIQKKSNNDELKRLTNKLRKIERNARNEAAHQIVHIDDIILKRRTGYSSEEIVEIFKDILSNLNMNLKIQDWDSYDIMNDKIISSFDS